MNENAVQLSVFVYEIVNLEAVIAYKCHAYRMDSMIHAPDNKTMLYFYKLDPMEDNEDYRLKFKKKRKSEINRDCS